MGQQHITRMPHACCITESTCFFQERQTSFAVDCVRWLRQHYRQTYGSDMPVVLVGHSMGGLVARAAAIALASEAESGQ